MGFFFGEKRRVLVLLALLASAGALVLTGCGTTSGSYGKVASKRSGKVKKGGGYYLDDGPMDEIPENLMAVPDAVPRVERLASGPNKPYEVFGQTYTPMTQLTAYRQQGVGSWYGKKFHGQKTSSGETYDMFAMTAAHPTLPIPSYARVTSLETGRQVIVKVNDRGPFLSNRLIDLSYTAAYKLGYVNKGSGRVEVELLLPDEIDRINMARQDASRLVDLSRQTALRQHDKPVYAQPSGASTDAQLRSGYYLQLGAYQEASNAQAYQAKFSLDWAHRLPSLEVVHSGNYYKLLAGPFNSLAEATQAGEEMRSQGTSSFVVHR